MIYAINHTNCSPDACRHDGNRQSLELTRTAPRTNSSKKIRTEGWLGQTNNTDSHAVGSWDADDESHDEIADEIVELATDFGLQCDRSQVLKFIASGDDAITFDEAASRRLAGTGWEILVPAGGSDDGLEMNALDGFVFVDEYWTGFGNKSSASDQSDWVEALDAAGIEYEVAEYSEHSQSGISEVWAIVVAEDDEDAAMSAMNVHKEEFDADDLETLGLTSELILAAVKSARTSAATRALR